MKRTVATSWILACAFLVSVAAQTAQPPTGQQPPQAKPSEERTVTLTGCLAAGSQTDTFRLTNVRSAEQATAKAGEAVGTSGLKAGDAVQLIGADAAKLKAHIGHTVTVTGMLVPRKEGTVSPAAKPGTPGAREQEDVRFNLKSFKHVDATCTPVSK